MFMRERERERERERTIGLLRGTFQTFFSKKNFFPSFHFSEEKIWKIKYKVFSLQSFVQYFGMDFFSFLIEEKNFNKKIKNEK